MRDKYIQGIYNEYAGLLDQHLADLHVLLSNPAGIADHGSISEEIKSKIVEIEKYQSLSETVRTLFAPAPDGEVASQKEPE
tara:strand:- start:1962 stop:2204 length:243 start_codon:yes stop_codon:yes gene_type:complete